MLPKFKKSAAVLFAAFFVFSAALLSAPKAAKALGGDAVVVTEDITKERADAIAKSKGPHDGGPWNQSSLAATSQCTKCLAAATSFAFSSTDCSASGMAAIASSLVLMTCLFMSQWMKANSATMMKAIDEAVRHGAHLGLRRLRG